MTKSLLRIPYDQVCDLLTKILLSLGFESAKAKKCAKIFTDNTCEGVASHGLNRLPRFVSEVKTGIVDMCAEPELITAFGALEQWNGNRGIGPLNAEKAVTRAVELSRTHGIGCVGLANTNHWMRGGSYGLRAARAGCIGICWTNTSNHMPPWGAASKTIGNNPITISLPHGENPVLLDMAMSQFSNGKLEVLRRRGRELPLAGGYDDKGNLTTDPGAILKSHRPLPIGFWKGSGLAIVLDLAAALISNGDATKDICKRDQETGVSQVFIAIDIESRMGASYIGEKTDAILNSLLETPPIEKGEAVRYPGQNLAATRAENLKKGVPIEPELWQTIQNL